MLVKTEEPPKGRASQLLASKAADHGRLEPADETAVLGLRPAVKRLAAGEDIVRQGDRPDVAVLVLSGMLARYHTLPSGDRQYLSVHIKGDLPDIQSLFLTIMDHSLSALDQAEIALFPHAPLCDLLMRRPRVCVAFWRLTLVDAAIFREAITNNSARGHVARLAHFLCEQYWRAREAKVLQGRSCRLPLTQAQLGQALGMAHVSVNRALQRLRAQGIADLRSGRLDVFDWPSLASVGDFDPTYLHLDR